MLRRIVYQLKSLAKSLIVDMDEADIKDREDSEGTSQVEEEVRGVDKTMSQVVKVARTWIKKINPVPKAWVTRLLFNLQ